MSVVVSSVTFGPDAVELTWMRTPEDVRNEGQLVASRAYVVGYAHPGYRDEVIELREAAERLVADIEEDFDDAPVYTPVEDDEDDEDDE